MLAVTDNAYYIAFHRCRVDFKSNAVVIVYIDECWGSALHAMERVATFFSCHDYVIRVIWGRKPYL